jgi:cytochrome P450
MAEAYQYQDRDVIAPEVYGRAGHPHDAFTWLRANDPLHWCEPEGYLPFWAVTKHADIVEIEKQPELFLSEPRPIIGPEITNPDLREEVIAEIFKRLQDSPKLLQVLAGSGQQGLIRSRELDFVQDVAVYHPLKMINELLGVPDEDEWRILKLTNELFAGDDPEMKRVGDDPLSMFETIKDLYEYFDRVTEDRRKNPTEDLASYIANGKIDGEYLPFRELISYYVIVATAGHETTRTAMSGGLLALMENRDQLQKLTNNREQFIKLGVEEMIRWSTPVAQFSRTATQDYTLRGKTIAAGDTVGLFYAAANRDEEVFDDPFSFRVDRQPNKHISFGYGPHICLGILLARMEMRIFFNQFLQRLDHVELAGEPDHLQASFVHGVKHLPIRVKLKPAAR